MDRASLSWLRVDLYGSMPALPDLDAIFSLGPLDGLANWLIQARFGAQPRLIALSSMSLLSKRDSTDAGERALAMRLENSEKSVIAAADSRGLDWTLLRPTLIYGAGLDRSLTPLARFGVRWRLFPHLPAARGLRQPVHAEDLAAACMRLLSCPDAIGRIYPVGGGERLTFGRMLESVRLSLPVRVLPVPLSLGMLRMAAGSLRLFGREWSAAAAFARLNSDQIADNDAARTDFGWTPRAFRPDVSCWVPPALP
ncbi:MAG: hypothetical protein WBV61_06090 [Rhodanobacteraceae bacterium]